MLKLLGSHLSVWWWWYIPGLWSPADDCYVEQRHPSPAAFISLPYRPSMEGG